MVLHIYVLHCEALTERTSCVESIKRLETENPKKVKVEVITSYDPETVDIQEARSKISNDPYPEDHNPIYKKLVRPMNIPLLSNLYKHMEALQRISKGNEEDTYLVLEDDVMFSMNLPKQINSILDNLKNKEIEWEIVFLGQPSMNQLDTNTISFTDIAKDCILPCCESYLVHKRSASRLVENLIPYRFTTNIQLSYVIDRFQMKAFKIFPNIVGDGSKMGNYVSSINPNNVLIFNQIYKEVYMIIENSGQMTEDDFNKALTILKTNTHTENPDILHLEGLLYKSRGNYDKAKEIFAKALENVKKNHGVLNNNSLFLRNYIDLYRPRPIHSI